MAGMVPEGAGRAGFSGEPAISLKSASGGADASTRPVPAVDPMRIGLAF